MLRILEQLAEHYFEDTRDIHFNCFWSLNPLEIWIIFVLVLNYGEALLLQSVFILKIKIKEAFDLLVHRYEDFKYWLLFKKTVSPRFLWDLNLQGT